MDDRTISLKAALGAIDANNGILYDNPTLVTSLHKILSELPPAEPEYEPVKAEDFAKTMSENTFYSFMAWHGEALELMERQGFVICKKTM